MGCRVEYHVNMRYLELLRRSACPFCRPTLNLGHVIRRTSRAFLLINLAPYACDHLLIVPTRHVTDLEKLTAAERLAMDRLVWQAVRIVRKRGHRSYSILARYGENSGRSVPHVHFHVIPDLCISNEEHASAERPVLSETKTSRLVAEYKKLVGRR